MSCEPLSLYLHIPFCSLKCSYCDFNSYAGLEALVRPYVDALIAEMGLWRDAVRGRQIATVYFGGGTPSLLPLQEIERIMTALRDAVLLDSPTEVTLEANPDTVNPAHLRGLLGLGVNRLSLGIQSFHNDELAILDRIHTSQEAKESYLWAREAGFQRVNLDLIYGLPVLSEAEGPEQPPERWQATLEQAIELGPEHLSLYALTVEEGTRLAYDVAHGRVPEPDPDAQAAIYEWSSERLARASYQQYEISNWSRPAEECRHNLTYWRNGEWLGLGAGAHSHFRGFRFANVYSPRQYIRRVQETAQRGVPTAANTRAILKAMRQVAYGEEQTPELAMADTAILALRLNDGISPADFRRRFGRELEDVYGPALDELSGLGLIERYDGRIRLTARGRLLANEVFVRLLPE